MNKTCKYCGVSKNINEFEIANIIKGKTYRRNKCGECKNKSQRKRIAAMSVLGPPDWASLPTTLANCQQFQNAIRQRE